MRALRSICCCLALLAGVTADAHAMRSAYVEVIERSPGCASITVRTQVPVAGLSLAAEAPCAIENASETGAEDVRILRCPRSVAGAQLKVDGLGAIVSEAVVWAALTDGTSASMLATHDRPAVTLPSAAVSALGVARQYVALGVAHILTGFDHLLFLLGLVVALRRPKAVLLAETAFTLSHSLSFSASALGWVRVSPPAVEACIALSLVLIALDAPAARRKASTPARAAGLAFLFGLMHGLGFAGGLAEIGLPDRAIPAALAGFACGVELGQVAFLSLLLLAFAVARRGAQTLDAPPRAERVLAACATYAVGCAGFYLFFERVRSLLFPLA